jgi:hypothetical protein
MKSRDLPSVYLFGQTQHIFRGNLLDQLAGIPIHDAHDDSFAGLVDGVSKLILLSVQLSAVDRFDGLNDSALFIRQAPGWGGLNGRADWAADG